MSETRFTKDHEWIKLDGDVGMVGISDYAQQQLGDVVFIELPSVGKAVAKGDEAAVVESVKAASEIYAPVSGTVVAVNNALESDPAAVNRDALGAGWFFKLKISDKAEFGALMDKAAYDAFVAELG